MPGDSAFAVSVPVPVTLFEPITDVAPSVRVLSVIAAGWSVTVCERAMPVGSVAVTTTGVVERTGFVRIGVCPDVAPVPKVMGCGVAIRLVFVDDIVAV